MADETITEFEELDPTEMHLVPAGANGFPFLLAKAVGEAIDEVRSQEPIHQEKETTKMDNSEPLADDILSRPRQEIGRGLGLSPQIAGTTVDRDPFRPLVEKIEAAKRADRVWEVRELEAELAKARFVAAERARQENPGAMKTRFGPGVTPLISNRHALKDDPGVSYV